MQLTAFPGTTSRVADGEGDWVTTEEGDWVTAGGGGQNELSRRRPTSDTAGYRWNAWRGSEMIEGVLLEKTSFRSDSLYRMRCKRRENKFSLFSESASDISKRVVGFANSFYSTV